MPEAAGGANRNRQVVEQAARAPVGCIADASAHPLLQPASAHPDGSGRRSLRRDPRMALSGPISAARAVANRMSPDTIAGEERGDHGPLLVGAGTVVEEAPGDADVARASGSSRARTR